MGNATRGRRAARRVLVAMVPVALTLGAACSDRPAGARPGAVPVTTRTNASPAVEYDLTASGATAVINGAIFEQRRWSSSASGRVDPVVRLAAVGTEQGYNTSARPVQFDQENGRLTRDLRLDDVPIVRVGLTEYRALVLLVDQAPDAPVLSLEALRVFVGPRGGASGVWPARADFGIGATLIYDLAGAAPALVKLEDVNAADHGARYLRVLIPNTSFGPEGRTCQYDDGAGTDCTAYVYVYSRFGPVYPSNGGAETWAAPNAAWVAVTPTAATSFRRAYTWTLAARATPAALALLRGDIGSAQFAVTATKAGSADADWAVRGTVAIENPTAFDAVITAVDVRVSGIDTAARASCATALPHALAPGASMRCTYGLALPDASPRSVTASVALDGAGDNRGTTTLAFGAPTTEIGNTVTVRDSYGGQSWTFASSGTQRFTRAFTCDADRGSYTHTATIVETGQSATAGTRVECYALQVTRIAQAELTRAWTWGVVAERDPSVERSSRLVLQTAQPYRYAYEATVSTTGSADMAWRVGGSIVITNPAPVPATILSVSQVLSGIATTMALCPSTTVPASGALACTFRVSVPDASSRSSVAAVIARNRNVAWSGGTTVIGTTTYTSAPMVVTFANARVTRIDDCVAVSDSRAGALGTVCATDRLPKRVTYSLQLGPYPSCGAYQEPNTVTYTTTDRRVSGRATYAVTARVTCPACTLTPEYWGTHNASANGRLGGPVDAGWALIGPGRETAPFFDTGTSYFDVLSTPATDPYRALAREYVAAKLNVLNGASATAVAGPLAAAEAFFGATAAGGWPDSMAATLGGWTNALRAFNRGNRCSEDWTSSPRS